MLKKFKVKGKKGFVVGAYAFSDGMSKTFGKTYFFSPIDRDGEWWKCDSSEETLGYRYHISWLEEIS